jgi:hypothetical protein
MVAGFPAELLHGPELPLSSQFMNWLPSFQILKIRTMPLPSDFPTVVRPPRLAAVLSDDAHHDAVMESWPDDDTAFGIALPFWMYERRISVRVPVVVPSLVINCVMTVNGSKVLTVPPLP